MIHGKASPKAFTLVELLLSTAVISLLLLLLTGIVNQTANTWRYTTTKVEQFRSSKNAFESITRRLSQATLNTYWDYQYKTNGALDKYVRQSDLRFISGSAEDLTAASAKDRPGHAVFFQAPLGFVDDPNFTGLSNLLNTWGYYVEFNSDKSLRPDFLNNLSPPIPERFRFRLMELMQPANNLNIYPLTATANYKGRGWFTSTLPKIPPTTTAASPVHVLAENVITLVLLPKLSVEENKTAAKPLAPGYKYDSTDENADAAINPKNQLPPIVQVTLVALDERSAARLTNGSTAPDLGLDKIFKADGTNGAAQFTADLATLEATLAAKNIAYRVFTTNVSIRGAKWSRN